MPSASRRRFAVVLVATAALLALGGCATATPLCDQGDVLTEVGALGRATEAYARASRAGEGECADSGLTASGARYADGYTNVVQGRAAEDTRNLDGAIAAYRAALAVDDGNVAARDALARLGQPVPEFREPEPVPPETPVAPDAVLLVAVSVTATVLACALLGVVAWLLRRRSRSAARSPAPAVPAPDVPAHPGEVLTAPAGAETGSAAAKAGFDQAAARSAADLLAGLREQRAELVATRGELVDLLTDGREDLHRLVEEARADTAQRAAALRQHLDDVADYLDHRLPDHGPVRERFAPSDTAADAPPGTAGPA